MVCVYTFQNGDVVRGKPALKAYLTANLASLLPERAAQAGFKRSPVAAAVQSGDMTAKVQRVEQVIANNTSGWTNNPRVIVVADMNDVRIPAFIRESDAKQRADNPNVGAIRGFYHDDTLFMIASELETDQDTATVLFHEGLGHYGLRGVFGEGLNAVLQQVIALRKTDVKAKITEYGLVKNMAEARAAALEKDSTLTGDALEAAATTELQDAYLEAAEEVLADMAMTTPQIGFVKRAIAAIRTWLRQNVKAFANMEMSDAEIIRSFILPARAFVEQGGEAGRAMAEGARFSRAPAVDSNAFKRWFKQSKVVDAEGKPLVIYRGMTTEVPSVLEPTDFFGSNLFGKGINLTSSAADASKYASTDVGENLDLSGKASIMSDKLGVSYQDAKAELTKGGGAVVPLYASIQNPLTIGAEKISPKDSVLRLALAEIGFAGDVDRFVRKFNEASSGVAQFEFALNNKATQVYRQIATIQNYDGLIIKPEVSPKSGGATHYLVFESTQLKSATGNNGQFDPSNPDIRYNRAPAKPSPAPAGLILPEQGLLRRVQSAIQDNFNRVRQVQERITEITGQPIPERSNYYGAEANRPGRVAARLEDAKRDMTEPLMAKLAKSGHTMEELGELLHAMHAQERNEAVARINKDMPDGGSGMMTADANAILRKYATNKTLQKLANEARDIAKATLELKLAYGLIDIETFDALASAYQNYVPLKGDGEFGPKVKRAMGHEEREEMIVQNIARDYELAVVAGEKNIARQSLLSMVLENPDPELWTVGVPPRGRYIAGKVFSVMRAGKEVATFTSGAQVSAFLEAKGAQAGQYTVVDSNGERVQEFVKPLQDNEVMVYVDGKPVRIQINGDDQLARQLRPLDQGQMNPILEVMRGINRYLSKIYTGYNPAFIIKNTARDAMTGTINMVGNEGAVTAAKAWGNYPKAMKALAVYAATGKSPTGEAGKMLEEYRQHGGKTGASYMSDLEEQGKTLQRMFDDAYGAKGYLVSGKPGKAALIAGRKIVGGMAHVIEVMNQATENGLRLALYMAMRNQGKTAGEAAQAAKSVTVDFDRKGSMTPALGAIFLFFNPAVQGTANAIKTLFKGAKKEQAWMALGALAALGAYAAGQGMDDDEDRWLGEGWESRSKIFFLNIGGHSIKVPLSMEFAPFYAAGVAMAEAKRKGTSKMAAAGHLVSSFIDAYFPLQGMFSSESDNHALDAAMATVPTVLKPGVQIAVNRNSFGSQVVPDNEFTKDRPDNLKMFRGTKGSVFDATAQGIAKGGEALGSGRYENDITKVSPETLKMMWRTYTGGLGQFVTDMGGLANVAAQDGKNVETSDVPVVKDFVKVNDVKAIRGRFYDLTKDARAVSEEFKQAKKAGDDAAMDDIESRPEKAELLGLDRLIKSTTKAAAGIRDEMVDINQDKTLNLAQKRAQLKALEKEEEELYRDAIKAFKP